MCWVCDHPDATRLDRLDYVRGLLDQHCWVVVGVPPERYRAGYSYTVGLTDHELPELVFTGLSADTAAELLNAAAERALGGEPPAPGVRLRLPGGAQAETVRITEPWVHLGVAAEFFGDRLRAVQLVYTDGQGRWPWDARFRDGRGGQPVLGARASRAACRVRRA